MTINTEYFIVERENNNNHPLLEWAGTTFQGPLARSARDSRPVQFTEPIQLKLGAPIPPMPEMVDYHSLPEPIIGQKIKDVLEPLNIEGIQFIPAKVDTRDKGLGVFDYWYLHVYNRITCMDKEKSVCSYSPSGRITDIKKLVLADYELKHLPLEERLIFVLKEYTSVYLFHESIKDKIMSDNPVGIRFFRVDKWGSSAAFE
jgi:hypothetical protein